MYIDGFDVPKGNFFFGVTDSVEGGGASLLIFHDSLYMVDAIVMPKDNLRLTRGSIIPITDSQSTQRGVRCLWFVIDAGMTQYCTLFAWQSFVIIKIFFFKDPPVSTMGTPDKHGLFIGVGVGVVLGILVLLGGMTSVGMALIVKYRRRNPQEIIEPLALDDWVDPQTQKGT